MSLLAADITMRTAPRIVIAAILGCLIVGVLITLLLRIAAAQAVDGRSTSTRADVRRAVRLIAHFTRAQHRIFVVGFLLLSVEAVTQVFAWYPLAYMIDYFDGAQGPLGFPGIASHRYATIAVLTSVLLVLLMVNSATDSLAEICLARGGRTLGFRMRVGLFSHLQRLSLAFHDRSRKGDMMFRVVGDVKEFEQFVIDALSDLAGSVLLLVATIAFLLYEAWQVMLVGLIVIPGTSLISYYFSTRIKAAAKRQRAREGDLAAATQEMLTSIRIVQTFGRGGHDEQKFVDNSNRAMTAALDAARLEAWFSWIVSIFEALAIAAVIWVGVYLLDHKRLSLGTLTLVALLIRQMFKPSKRIIKEWNIVSKVFASVERIADLLDRPVTVTDAPGAVAAPPLRGGVEFRDVEFLYQGEDGGMGSNSSFTERPPALTGVSFTVEPGEVVAIGGPSGAGKSTIAQLIPRLYDPQAGAVLLDGHDVREFTLDSVRAQISMVLQDTVLLSGSVAENIAYGRPDATPEEIVAAAVRANADEFIEALPDGYDTDLSEQGSNLSGGQRQRIAIARAIIRGTPIMILDEPTTGLDAQSAELVLTGLRELMRGKTTILISHDPELLRSADRMLLLQSGRIVASGRPEQLLGTGNGHPRLPVEQPAAGGLPAVHAGNGNGHGALDASEIDPRLGSELRRELPALDVALDEDSMRHHLQRMFEGAGWTVEHCTPGKALYVPDQGCTLRYRVRLAGGNGGGKRDVLVGGRLFADPQAARPFLRDRVSPLAERTRQRSEMEPFALPAIGVDELGMVAHAFPIDADLPGLVAATDAREMCGRLNETLSRSSGEKITFDDCQVELASYARRGRCLLRYRLSRAEAGPDGAAGHTVYGKLGAGGSAPDREVMDALRSRLNGAQGVQIPRLLGTLPELDLALFEAIPGQPRIGQLLTARCLGRRAVELEGAIGTCARIAAGVHGCGLTVARTRTLYDEVTALHPGLDAMRRVTPALGERLDGWIDQVLDEASEHDPVTQRLCHGDYTHNQVVFHRRRSGLLDFDDVCMAEPALDLGRFCAYLRVAAHKAALAAQREPDPGDELCRRFLTTYLRSAGVPADDRPNLRGRVDAYEAVTLARVVVNSWQQLKPARTACALSVLEERMACLPTPAL